MEERKQLRYRAKKQKRGLLYRKSAAATAALVSTVNISRNPKWCSSS